VHCMKPMTSRAAVSERLESFRLAGERGDVRAGAVQVTDFLTAQSSLLRPYRVTLMALIACE
jgi:hypothetical protein